ncbi:cation-translocating P-type ATPase [Leptospira wolffii]|uniref:cation-translocating P-type ATPase n=1 Tax=Leptospira wolffii TaxID=409998 RepID=UPI00031C1982|nr:cation-translocating P-type ATPase [Leptospira wolffii]EPG64105.1 putative calcium-translocating P-type ATPase, PMCA-type [Leptospira wolffii serovar Khorat str. Khorat-H2]
MNQRTGLSQKEAENLLLQFGKNEIGKKKEYRLIGTILEVLEEPILFLLVICAGLYIALGDMGEAILLSTALIFIISITIYQKNKMENAISALKEIASPKATVLRDGTYRQIPGSEVVPGDLVLVREGERICADGILINQLNLKVDESALTGESIPVTKSVGNPEIGSADLPPGGNDSPFVFSSGLVVYGEGVYKVLRTGSETQIGRIGLALETISTDETPLQSETKSLTLWITLFALAVCVFLVTELGLRDGRWIHAFLAGLTFSMAALPEEIPVVLTVYLALGAWRISQVGVLTRSLGAIETLGSASVLCVDKTGTLTENRMAIRRLYVPAGDKDEFLDTLRGTKELPEEFHSILEYAILASKRDPFDPMEKAIQELGFSTLTGTEHLHSDWTLEKEYSLSPELMALSFAWKREDHSSDLVIGTKGAPEAIFDLCHMNSADTERFKGIAQKISSEGLRVLGVARSKSITQKLPANQHDLDFEFLGLIGLEDPIRKDVPESLRECIEAGIRVVMITGDYIGTAKSVAQKIGLSNFDRFFTGEDLAADKEGVLDYKNVGIFSRIRPEQKLSIVQRFQKEGEIVAMTGDGVNDAPALKAAHIGVSMGKRGTDVAREASDIVLLEDDFSAIVHAVALGRRIYENIKKSIRYIISVHVPIIGLSVLPVFIGGPLFFFPAHILFMELIIDPASSLIFEREEGERNLMKRPPRSRSSRLVDGKTAVLSILQGTVIFAVVLGVFLYSESQGWTRETSRSLAFIALVSSNLTLILTNLSWEDHLGKSFRKIGWSYYILLLFTVTVILGSFSNEFTMHLFGFERISWASGIQVFLIGAASSCWWEIVKWVRRN